MWRAVLAAKGRVGRFFMYLAGFLPLSLRNSTRAAFSPAPWRWLMLSKQLSVSISREIFRENRTLSQEKSRYPVSWWSKPLLQVPSWFLLPFMLGLEKLERGQCFLVGYCVNEDDWSRSYEEFYYLWAFSKCGLAAFKRCFVLLIFT